MQSSAVFSASPSLPLLKPGRLSLRHPVTASSNLSVSPPNVVSVPPLPRRSWRLASSDSPLRAWSGLPSVSSPSLDTNRFKTAATAVPEEGEGSGKMTKVLELGLLFAMWYLFNIYFNIYNKQVLKALHAPMTVTLVQFAVGSVLITFMWALNLYKRPKISAAQLAAILPLAVVHTLGNLFTNMSLGKVSVSFTHTIKAMEPFFSVVLSAMFLGEVPTPWVIGSIIPIVGGVALASVTEVSFNWAGFLSAMASNLTNQSRNVLSKKVMVKKDDSLDNITLFSIITLMSLFLMAPVTFFSEGIKFTPSYIQSAGILQEHKAREKKKMCSSKSKNMNQEAISQINGRPVLQPKSNQVPTVDRRNSLKKSPPKSLIHPIASKIASPRPKSLNSPPLSPNSKPIRKLACYEKPKPAAKPVKLSERTDGGCREVKSTVTVQKQPGSIAAARREEVAMKQEERKKKISHYGRVKSVQSNEKNLNVEHEKKKRCSFITTSSDPIYVAYHDEEWGVPVHDDNLLFELLVLTGAQVGSDWTSVLKRRNTFREAFSGFEPELVAEFNEKKIQSIVNDYGIGLSQVLAIVDNSKQILKVKRDFGSFNKYIWGFMKHKPVTTKYTSCQKIPVKTSKSETISKDMVRRGFRFVGPTVIHSLMQAAGLTIDHLITCPRHLECMVKAAL